MWVEKTSVAGSRKTIKSGGLILALDFDGTCVEHVNPPAIGAEIGAAPYLKKLSDSGVKLILWTMRSQGYTGLNHPAEPYDALAPALAWFQKHQIELWGINQNSEQAWTKSPKVYAHLILDDSAFGCPLVRPEGRRPYVDWQEVGSALLAWAGVPGGD
jgi:hypothetical protein